MGQFDAHIVRDKTHPLAGWWLVSALTGLAYHLKPDGSAEQWPALPAEAEPWPPHHHDHHQAVDLARLGACGVCDGTEWTRDDAGRVVCAGCCRTPAQAAAHEG